ncbi:putative neural-cadherin 2 [Chaetodon auriga]|uniref:putative neural-cadherin 2 n=1 Tax=Chaetodon auriga TaxID=39042 RepID=UPI004032F2D5
MLLQGQRHSVFLVILFSCYASSFQLYDLGSPVESSNTVPGCSLIDDHCTNKEQLPSCGKRGRCHDEGGSFSCVCEPGFTGPQCDQVAPEFSFDGCSHIHFQLLWSLSARQTRVQVGIRTRATAGVILSLLSQKQNEYLRLEVIQGLLAVFYNLGDGDYNLTLSHYRIDDGEWHEVEVDRLFARCED